MAEYDTPGGEPFTAMISPFEFDSEHSDIIVLKQLAEVAASSHCPFIGNVGARFFNQNEIGDISKLDDLREYMDRADYIRWNAFRETDAARYVALTLPKFLVRLSYNEMKQMQGFQYYQNISGSKEDEYLWGQASFALASNLSSSFKEYGWCVNIRGAESGGRVNDLPLPRRDLGGLKETLIPTECLISETRELALSELGFIPLSYYKNSDFACFFSANSIQKSEAFDDPKLTANARINARLPYIFLSSRLAHYLKVLQRESIGSNRNRVELEQELNGCYHKLTNSKPE